MKTEVILKRTLLDGEVSQLSKTGFYCLNDLFAIGNNWRALNRMPLQKMNDWISQKTTVEFIKELERQFGTIKISRRGRKGQTWVHPYLFIDAALHLNPRLKIEVYRWLYDELLRYRNDSGDSYRSMAGSLYDNSSNKSTFHKSMSKVAKIIREACGVSDWNRANENQLKLRDTIHNNIALLADVLRDNNQAVRYGVLKAKDMIK